MDRYKQDMTDHYVVEQVAPKWLGTILVSLGGTLAGALLIWVATSTQNLTTQMAVVQRDLHAQNERMFERIEAGHAESERMRRLLDTIWPRLRAHGENIVILKREIEELCECKVELTDPEII